MLGFDLVNDFDAEQAHFLCILLLWNCATTIASFPDPAQVLVAYGTEKAGNAWDT